MAGWKPFQESGPSTTIQLSKLQKIERMPSVRKKIFLRMLSVYYKIPTHTEHALKNCSRMLSMRLKAIIFQNFNISKNYLKSNNCLKLFWRLAIGLKFNY
jgi:hypothetical protein